jgi:hypothetical protein
MTDTDPPPRPSPLRLDLRVAELRQLFNPMDASPFRERDLDPDAEAFIVDWAGETPSGAPLAITVHRSGGVPHEDDEDTLRHAMREYFAGRAANARLRRRRLLRAGRHALVVGLAFVALAITIGDLVGRLAAPGAYGRLVQDSVVIGAWVALWRPMEIFLYDWWPIHAEARLHDRLSAARVDLVDD